MAFKPDSFLTAQNMEMPVVGLGTWQSGEEEIDKAITSALDIGYRHIDTAYVYSNEVAIGKTLEKLFSSGKFKRENLFIVTKLPNIGNRPKDVERFMKKSLEALKLDYVDLYLVHNPMGLKCSEDDNIFPLNEKGELDLDLETDHIALWKAMEALVDKKYTKAIGLSNFNQNQVDKILRNCRIPPSNLQVEMHVYLQQKELLEFCKKNNVTICAYAPLGSPGVYKFTENVGFSSDNIPKQSPMSDPSVQNIAKNHGKTTAQVLLKFLMQAGVAVIPKSTNPDRIKQNFEVFDFSLSEEEMIKLKALDKGETGRMFTNGIFKGTEKHPEFPY